MNLEWEKVSASAGVLGRFTSETKRRSAAKLNRHFSSVLGFRVFLHKRRNILRVFILKVWRKSRSTPFDVRATHFLPGQIASGGVSGRTGTSSLVDGDVLDRFCKVRHAWGSVPLHSSERARVSRPMICSAAKGFSAKDPTCNVSYDKWALSCSSASRQEITGRGGCPLTQLLPVRIWP